MFQEEWQGHLLYYTPFGMYVPILKQMYWGWLFSVWFGFYKKKITKPKFFFEKKTETGSNRPVSVRFGFLGQKPVQTGLARFSRFWLGFFRFWLGFFWFGSVFPVWLGFFSGFLSGSVRFFAYKTETEPAGFFKNLIGLIGFFFGSVFSVFFFRFSRFNRFSGFFAHP